MKIKFQYDSDNGSKLEIYIGVEKVEQNPESKITNNIKSEILFEEMLGAGQKSKFEKEYSVNTLRQINGCNIILRIMSLNSDERTQYSVKNVGSNNWKILL